MPGGVRLVVTDPDLRGRVYLVEHPTRKYIVPKICADCNVVHVKKTYHLRPDPFDGSIIVSPEIFERLREAGLPKMEVANAVLSPPVQRVGIHAPVSRVDEAVLAEASGGRLAVYKNRLTTPRKIKKVKRYG